MTFTKILEFALWKDTERKNDRAPQTSGSASFTCPKCQFHIPKIRTSAYTNKPDPEFPKRPLIKGEVSIGSDALEELLNGPSTVPVPAAPLDDFDSDLPF
jgi:hypothetical protein